jgi:polysaccharide biosynthesis/export protein
VTAPSKSHLQRPGHSGLGVFLFVCALAPSLIAQTPQSSSTTTNPASGPSMPTPDARASTQSQNSLTGADDGSGANSQTMAVNGTGTSAGTGVVQNLNEPGALSADQIFAILQEQPDSSVELKSLISTLATQQGTPIQADAITDEMLYSRIASSQDLRINITTFLRARGYVTDADLQSYASGNSDNNSLFLPQMSQMNGSISGSPGLLFNPQLNGAYGQNYAGMNGASGFGTTSTNRARTAIGDQSANLSRNTTSVPQVLHLPTPYNLRSLRDLYSQLPEQLEQLKRFGSEVFLRRDGFAMNQIAPNGREIPLDVPAGPDTWWAPATTYQ